MRRTLVVLSIFVSAVVIAFGVGVGRSTADNQSRPKQFSAVLNGGQETPAVDTEAIGVAHLVFTPTNRQLCLDMTAVGLEGGAITAAHVHKGGPGVAGDPIIDLGVTNPFNDKCGSLSDRQAALLSKGRLYLNVHTTSFPNGEIRGQILR